MASCCEDKSCELAAMRANHGRVLWIVLVVNAAMFFVEGAAGLLAHSTSLLADALDMLGDALVYGFSLFVLARSARWQAGAALAKGVFMLVFGLGVLAEAADKIFNPVLPGVATMGLSAPWRWPPTWSAFSCSTGTAATISTCARPGCARATTLLPMSACCSPQPPAARSPPAGRTSWSARRSRHCFSTRLLAY